MYGDPGMGNRINAEAEAELLATIARGGQPYEEDPAGLRAERITTRVRLVIGLAAVAAVAAFIGFVYLTSR